MSNHNDINETLVKDILNKIDNVSDDSILSLTMSSIENENREILKTIGLNDDKCNEILNTLYGYKLIENITDLEYGLFTRIIKLNNISTLDDIKSIKMGLAVNCYDAYSKVHNRNRVYIRFRLGNYFNCIAFDDCIMFQKIRNDDRFVMELNDYLQK
jgi:hypothetical protein